MERVLIALRLQKIIVMFMEYCRSKQLRAKTMASYEQTLKLFARWLWERYDIENADEVKEPHIRSYTLSRILGHSSVSVSEKAYLDVTDDDLKKRYRKFSPLEGIFFKKD